MMRFGGAVLLVAGLTLAAVSTGRLASVYPQLRDLGPEASGLTGPASGPDSLPRTVLAAGIEVCRQEYAAGVASPGSVGSAAVLDRCVAFAEAFAAAAPADPWVWLQVARTRLDRDGPGPSALAALRRSWRAGPADGSVLPQRAATALRLRNQLDATDRAAFDHDVAETVRLRGDLVAIARLAVVGPSSLGLVREAMAAMPADDQEVLLAALRSAAAARSGAS
jgi:hypothetical protein